MRMLAIREHDQPHATRALRLGLIATCAMLLGSFGGGAFQRRGGVLDLLGWEFFAFGHGAAFSNVTLWSGTICLIVAWVILGRAHITAAELQRILFIWIVPLVFAGPIMSRDVYSYLMQGTLLRDGFDPYTQAAALNPNAVLFEVSHDWRTTTTPYGPLHLWLGKLVTSISGDHVLAGTYIFKLLAVAGFVAIVLLVPKLAGELGLDPRWALWIGVANPVMIIHLVGGMHNEALMVALVCLGLLLIVRAERLLMVLAGIGLIAVGMALKATAAFCLPFVIWIYVYKASTRSEAFRRWCVSGFLGALTTVVTLWIITKLSGSTWGWIAALTGNSKVINPLSVPSLIADTLASFGSLFFAPFPYNEVLAITRLSASVIMLVGFVSAWWFLRKQPMLGMAVMYMVMFSFNAVTLPWYYASVFVLLGLFPLSRRWAYVVIIGSIVVASAFTGSGNHQLYNPVWMSIAGLAGWFAASWVLQDGSIQQILRPRREPATTHDTEEQSVSS